MSIPMQGRLASAVAASFLLLSATTAECRSPTSGVAAAQPETKLEHISVQVIGKGSPVILIPGLASPRAVWDGIVPELAKNHSVHLVQVNGFGGDAPGDNLKPGLLNGVVADLDRYISANRLKRPAMIGHSMGGLVGLMLAKAHPTDVGRLMVVDALPYFAVLMAPPGVDPTPAMVAPQAAMMRDKVAANYGKTLDAATIDAQLQGMTLKPDNLARMRVWAAAADARVTAEAMYEDLTTDIRPDLAAIQTSITLVYPWSRAGLGKAMVDPFYRKQYAAAKDIRFVAIGDSAHFVMLDQPEQFQAAVRAFLL